MGGPATTNPWLIALINMTIVFGVLAVLGVFMNLIYMVDPTKKKASAPAPVAPAPAAPVVVEEAPAQDDDAIIAVIAAAVAAYGYAPSQITSIQPVPARSWTYTARQAAVSSRNQMF